MTQASNKRPHVLLTNDDGIQADGIGAMARALESFCDLLVVAPASECSGQGHAISVLKDIQLEPYEGNGLKGWGLRGTPADCVKVAVATLAVSRPLDFVISGINRGQNAGINTLYSGTVAAAREGAVLGIPALAVSLETRDVPQSDYRAAARVGVDMLRLIQEHPLPRGLMLNVNVPALAYDRLKGWAVTRMGNSGYSDLFKDETADVEIGPKVYRNIGNGWNPSTPVDEEVDDHALAAGYVSITPLHFDLTAHRFIPRLLEWLAVKK
jgi:5'-nucleotidase